MLYFVALLSFNELNSSTCCSDEVGALCAQSVARMKNKGTALVANGPTHDALEDLLNAMAVVYDVFPDLWLDQELRYGTSNSSLHHCWHLAISHACNNIAL